MSMPGSMKFLLFPFSSPFATWIVPSAISLRAEYPTFKKKRDQQAATYTSNAFTWKDSSLTLAKMDEPLEIVWSRPLPDGCKPSSVTITKDEANRDFVSFLVEEDIAPLPVVTKQVGLDLG